MRIYLVLILLLAGVSGFAQDRTRPLVQFSGVITNADSNTVVPYVTITNNSTRNAYSANYKGYFSFVVHEGDTMTFSAVGFRPQSIVIPSNIADHSYTVQMKLKQEIINLPSVRVYPWASSDEFNKEFIAMKFADDDLEIAKKNVSRESLNEMIASLPRDAGEMQNYSFQGNHNRLVNKNMNQRLANPLLNPFAWGALIQQIVNGDKSREQ